MTKINGKHDRSSEKNYLDLVPKHNSDFPWESSPEGIVTIYQKNTGLANRLAQKFAGKPEVSQIHLDRLGSFIWRNISSKRSIYDIALLVKDEFGEDAEPLYDRLVQYMHTLESYGFILLE